jgi:hypothetical protein
LDGRVPTAAERRLASWLGVAVPVLLVAGLVAIVAGADRAAGQAPPAAAPAPATDGGHAAHPATAGDMAAVQHSVQSAWCPEPGSEIAPGEPEGSVRVVASGGGYGDGPVTIPARRLVRLLLVNDDDVAHELGVYHASRPGCPLALAEAAPGEEVAVDVRLAPGTYVYGDRTHPGERDLLVAE